MALATVQEVKDVTGRTLDSESIAIAQTIIELYSNRTEDAVAAFSERDKHWLKLAVAYQAAYLDDNPGILTERDVASMSQGDLTVSPNGQAFLAPIAKMALKKISWNKTRSVRLSSDFVDGALDASFPWKQINQ